MSDHAKSLENEDAFGADQQAHKITDASYILPVEKGNNRDVGTDGPTLFGRY